MLAQIIAVTIFVVMFVLIVMDRIPRQWVTIGCGALTMVLVFGVCMKSPQAMLQALNIRAIFKPDFWIAHSEGGEVTTGINWATIIFIFGMMVMVEGMARVGFFRWLCMEIARLVKYKIQPLFIAFFIMSFCLAMFIDSITVILFLVAVTIELSRLMKFDPIPMVVSEIFAANLGGSATMCGDPPNIIIGTSLGYSFFDFLLHTGLIALLSLVVILAYFYLVFKKELVQEAIIDPATVPEPKTAIKDMKGFVVSAIIFLCAVVLLVSHAATGLTVAFIGVAVALITLITSFKHIKEIMSKVDYATLLFFMGLFVVVDGLEQTGVLTMIANVIAMLCNGNAAIMVAIIIWISGIASAFVDNIPFAATMVPIIQTLSATQGVHIDTLAWSLALGTDVGGSATPIGASANVVGISTSTKAGHPITWGYYCKKAAPATCIVLLISTAVIIIRYL